MLRFRRERETSCSTYLHDIGGVGLVGAEGLLHVSVLEEGGDGEDVAARVHEDEEEGACEVETREAWVVLHHQVQQLGHLLHYHRVKGHEQLRTKRHSH